MANPEQHPTKGFLTQTITDPDRKEPVVIKQRAFRYPWGYSRDASEMFDQTRGRDNKVYPCAVIRQEPHAPIPGPTETDETLLNNLSIEFRGVPFHFQGEPPLPQPKNEQKA